jgi:hypothetical protein
MLIDSNVPACVEHVGHESRRSSSARGIYDVGDNCRESASDGISDDSSRCRPGKDFDLARSVEYDMAVVRT